MTNNTRALTLALPMALIIASGGPQLIAQQIRDASDSLIVPITTHKIEVDKLANAVAGQYVMGLVVGLVGKDGTEIYGYGETSSNGRVPDKDTLFEIGSMTKTFTSLILSKAVEDHKLLLDQPIQELLPNNVRVPINGNKVTLVHLSTHTAGFPNMASNFNSESSYTINNLYSAVNSLRLSSQPGSQWLYSNFGVGLLGHALALHAGKSYETLLKTEVLEPLGMNDTAITLTPEQSKRLAQPHDPNLRPVPPISWKSDALVGAGGIRTTATDLLKYLAAQAGLSSTPLTAAMQQTHIPRVVTTRSSHMGLAWFVDDTTGFRYHGGKTYGSTSFMGFDPASKTAVLVLSNGNDENRHLETMGFSLMRMMAGDGIQTDEEDKAPADVEND